jgi:hypothetical protein
VSWLAAGLVSVAVWSGRLIRQEGWSWVCFFKFFFFWWGGGRGELVGCAASKGGMDDDSVWSVQKFAVLGAVAEF